MKFVEGGFTIYKTNFGEIDVESFRKEYLH